MSFSNRDGFSPKNGLDRYLATIEGRPVDHLARVPILMPSAAGHVGSPYGAFASEYRVLTDAIRQAVRDCHSQAGTPFMVCAGCEIPSRTPVENLRAFCEPVPYGA
jgi:uroporphyrinogen-III decarboxylase